MYFAYFNGLPSQYCHHYPPGPTVLVSAVLTSYFVDSSNNPIFFFRYGTHERSYALQAQDVYAHEAYSIFNLKK